MQSCYSSEDQHVEIVPYSASAALSLALSQKDLPKLNSDGGEPSLPVKWNAIEIYGDDSLDEDKPSFSEELTGKTSCVKTSSPRSKMKNLQTPRFKSGINVWKFFGVGEKELNISERNNSITTCETALSSRVLEDESSSLSMFCDTGISDCPKSELNVPPTPLEKIMCRGKILQSRRLRKVLGRKWYERSTIEVEDFSCDHASLDPWPPTSKVLNTTDEIYGTKTGKASKLHSDQRANCFSDPLVAKDKSFVSNSFNTHTPIKAESKIVENPRVSAGGTCYFLEKKNSICAITPEPVKIHKYTLKAPPVRGSHLSKHAVARVIRSSVGTSSHSEEVCCAFQTEDIITDLSAFNKKIPDTNTEYLLRKKKKRRQRSKLKNKNMAAVDRKGDQFLNVEMWPDMTTHGILNIGMKNKRPSSVDMPMSETKEVR